jgi:type I restriction enzyme R subunit
MTESDLENACIAWFQELGYAYKLGFDIAPRGATPERKSFTQVILHDRLREALARLNPGLPASATLDAFERMSRFASGSLVDGNREMYHWIRDGVPVEIEADGGKRGALVQVVDWSNAANDWLVVNQFAVKGKLPVRPDMVVFLNGLPVGVIELKNPADMTADVSKAFNQITNYQNEVPQLFEPSAVNVISDGTVARVGSITADFDRYAPWKLVESIDPKQHLELEVLVRGLFRQDTFLTYLRDFILFQQESGKTFKIVAGYHQVRGTLKAVQRAKDALHSDDGLGGTVWFTQGSGKSFLALFYVAMLQQAPEFENPTFVMVTDRNDLDGQLFETFDAAYDKLRTKPVQIDSHDDLRRKLGEQPAGGIFFTTIQKFKPKVAGQRLEAISTRRNLVVICDEAHRTQYGFRAVVDSKTGITRYGLATHLRDAFPHAIFMGMTGTPTSAEDRDTQGVFGDYVDIYDVADSQADKTTVPILYEARVIDLAYNEQIDSDLDADLDALLDEDEDDSLHDRAVSRLTRLESVAMADNRLGRLAGDLVTHWEERLDSLDGKGMIVAISRKAAVALYDEITTLRPEWHDPDLNKGVIKIVMTSPASDPPELRAHALSATQKKTLEKRLKDPDDPLKLVIVRDMWLTGFDAPSLHTLYVDKPMKGSGLMQAIARVNRVWRDKPGGLVVDYIGIGPELRLAIAEYANLAKTTEPPVDFIDNAVPVLLDTVDVMRGMYRGFDYSSFRQSPQAMLTLLAPAMNHIAGFDAEDDGHGRNRGIKRYLDQATKLARLQALCGTHPEALALREEIAFFLVIRSMLVKTTRTGSETTQIEREAAMRQLVSKAIVVGGITDVYKSMGLEKPNISVLDEGFLGDIAQSPQRNLAAELLQRLIGDEIKARGRRNVSQQALFTTKLEEAIARYRARALTTVQVIEELLKLAHELNAAKPPEGMTEDEFAFYQALAQNESAVQIMGDPVLRALAHELTDKLRKSATVDWSKRESSRQRMRVLVKVPLGKYRYPPDKQPEAIDKVIEQAELFADVWAIDSE